jgi:hypothetical protein
MISAEFPFESKFIEVLGSKKTNPMRSAKQWLSGTGA